MVLPVTMRKEEMKLRSSGLEWQEGRRREPRAGRAKRGEGVSVALGSPLFFVLALSGCWRLSAG